MNDPNVALNKFDSALDAVSKERARMGAIQNRLESSASVLEINVENSSASRSRILDADFAVETANLARSNILMQAGTAMISQANTSPNVVLSLLNG